MADEKEKDTDKVNEPGAEYQLSEFKIFHSFEEMNEDQHAYWRGLTPEQRLADHYQILIHVYANALEENKRNPTSDITFTT